jgi:hypothetical protein
MNDHRGGATRVEDGVNEVMISENKSEISTNSIDSKSNFMSNLLF